MKNAYDIDDSDVFLYDGSGAENEIDWNKPLLPLHVKFLTELSHR